MDKFILYDKSLSNIFLVFSPNLHMGLTFTQCAAHHNSKQPRERPTNRIGFQSVPLPTHLNYYILFRSFEKMMQIFRWPLSRYFLVAMVGSLMIPLVCCTVTNIDCVFYNLGSFEMKLGSNVAFKKDELMDVVCDAMGDFFDTAFDTAYTKIKDRNNGFSCSIAADDIDIDGTSAPYTANITFYAEVSFTEPTKWTNASVADFMTAILAVEDGDQCFLHALMKQSNSDPFYPFLSNITYAAVKMNGDVVDDYITMSCVSYDSSLNVPMIVVMIALIGGLSAFFLLLCAVRADSATCYYRRYSRVGTCTAKLHDYPHKVLPAHPDEVVHGNLLPIVMATEGDLPCTTLVPSL
jgi:hypothetical protein